MTLSAEDVSALKLSQFFSKKYIDDSCKKEGLRMVHGAQERIFRLVKFRLCDAPDDFETQTVGQLMHDIKNQQISLSGHPQFGHETRKFFHEYLRLFNLEC